MAGPFGHTGVKFLPSGGITEALLPHYLAVPLVAAVGGTWLAERKLVAEKQWDTITAITARAMQTISSLSKN
jgi:2-dehydro-3-deoxyphosphogluconate aldolase/(4S)-4-hydroxy-2-oxoglutarate aldolase